ncbi:MAG: CLCA_X family protein, partial [Pseudoalteromonas sp.]
RHRHIKNSFLVGTLKHSGLIYPAESVLVNADKALNDYFSQLGYLLHQA